MSRLITPSLFSSVSWALNAPASNIRGKSVTWKQQAQEDLKNMLARVWGGMNDAGKRGVAFEDQVYKLLGRGIPIDEIDCSEHFRTVLRACEGGEFQHKCKRYIEIAGEEYCLYGKIDVWFEETKRIIDIKTTGNYKGRDKYLDSMQHKIYCFNTDSKVFDYIVAEFADDRSTTILDVHKIRFRIDDPSTLRIEIENRILEVLQFLESDSKLWDLYLTKYSSY